MRLILPAAPSVTNSAPPGPIVLPDPPSNPATKSVGSGGEKALSVIDAETAMAARSLESMSIFIAYSLLVRGLRAGARRLAGGAPSLRS